jgi:glycyl-tRNA synthetase beta chain
MTVMASHQKYFPLHDASGQKLLPYFLAVSNGKPESADSIRSGNEKVIRARLEDAKFFYADDCEILLDNRLEKLKGITFQKGMGTLLDKANRLESLTSKILPYLGVSSEASKKDALRAAKLAKTDLVSGMVFEFTELQGIMGYYYASVQKETSNVAQAIKEQYQPNFAGDAIPETECGRIISLVDKLDTLVAVFSRKSAKLPTGSKDPLGLRRMVNGIYQIAMAFQHHSEFDLKRLLEAAYEVVVANSQSESIKDKDFYSCAETVDLITTFFMQRVRSFLSDKGHRFDVIEAAIEVDEPLSEIHSVEKRIAGFEKLVQKLEQVKALYEPANRISNILGVNYNRSAKPADIKADLMKDASEKALYEQLLPLSKALSGQPEFAAYETELLKIAPAVEAFFTAVMVNDPDAAVKANRYALLSCLNQYYKKMGTFSKLTQIWQFNSFIP